MKLTNNTRNKHGIVANHQTMFIHTKNNVCGKQILKSISAHIKNGGNVKTCKQDLKTYLINLALY